MNSTPRADGPTRFAPCCRAPAAADYTSPELFEALDLCLECKACKTECPANVDMAKLKYEFLAHYNDRHGISLRARMFGNIARLSRIGSATAPASNWILQSRIFRRSTGRALGIHPVRKASVVRAPDFSQLVERGILARTPARAPPEGRSFSTILSPTTMNPGSAKPPSNYSKEPARGFVFRIWYAVAAR